MSETNQPEISMLWESADAAGALAERFKFADASAATAWLTDLLATHWGIELATCERLVISAGNLMAWFTDGTGRRLIAKWSMFAPLFPRLADLDRLTAWLAERGQPVAAPVPMLDGRLRIELDGMSIALQPVIDGDLLDVTNEAQVYATGVALAELHVALAAFPGPASLAAVADREKPQPLGSRTGVDAGMPDEFPIQLVHNDIRSANVLCTGSTINALLDLEEVTLDYRVADLAKSAVLLGTRYHDWGPVSAQIRANYIAGYVATSPLSAVEEAWLEALIKWQSEGFGWTT